jgi:hypothetical protein
VAALDGFDAFCVLFFLQVLEAEEGGDVWVAE